MLLSWLVTHGFSHRVPLTPSPPPHPLSGHTRACVSFSAWDTVRPCMGMTHFQFSERQRARAVLTVQQGIHENRSRQSMVGHCLILSGAKVPKTDAQTGMNFIH
ncbi:hypothetical protein ElyMa_004704500 [Elysia marginata]|uniref:Uncharacterized protein n=1 Tax=Elysia marginata TaxID=1093978 RepID=A0AAV4I7E6_9GAST|nr:hypothetical protein ElyMa_004704500 [Elysia marginata]